MGSWRRRGVGSAVGRLGSRERAAVRRGLPSVGRNLERSASISRIGAVGSRSRRARGGLALGASHPAWQPRQGDMQLAAPIGHLKRYTLAIVADVVDAHGRGMEHDAVVRRGALAGRRGCALRCAVRAAYRVAHLAVNRGRLCEDGALARAERRVARTDACGGRELLYRPTGAGGDRRARHLVMAPRRGSARKLRRRDWVLVQRGGSGCRNGLDRRSFVRHTRGVGGDAELGGVRGIRGIRVRLRQRDKIRLDEGVPGFRSLHRRTLTVLVRRRWGLSGNGANLRTEPCVWRTRIDDQLGQNVHFGHAAERLLGMASRVCLRL